MKHFVLISAIALVLLSSCATNKMATYSDDVYANPAIERAEDAKIASIQKAKEDAYRKRYNDSINNISLAQKAKDDANPYYKDREFKYDDYYDYEYATRVKRFDNSISGLGYYDNYYTNSYWYNKNPYNYGVSVYNGYSWWGNSYNNYSYNPSVNFYNNNGWGCNSNYGYNGYNPYMSGYSSGFSFGYNNGYNNGYYGMPYGNYFGYGNGYNNGFGNSYGYNPYGYNGWNNGYGNNGWGYYNGYDHNSSYTYGPRSSHAGGNDRQSSNPGMRTTEDSYYNRYKNAVVEKQEKAVKFEPISPPKSNSSNGNSNPIRNNNGYFQTGEIKNNNPVRNVENSNTQPVRNNNNQQQEPVRDNNQQQEPVRQQPVRNQNETPQYQQPTRQYEPQQQPTNNGGNSQPTNNGGSRPR